MAATLSSPTAEPSKAQRLWRRTRTGGLLTLALVAALWGTSLPQAHWPVWLIGSVLGLALAIEVGRMGNLAGRVPAAALVTALVFAAIALGPQPGAQRPFTDWIAMGPAGDYLFAAILGVVGAMFALTALSFIELYRGRRLDAQVLRPAVFLSLWLAAPLPALGLVRAEWGHGALIALLVLSKVGDIAGYYGGNAFGRHRPLPRLSPSKTSEGFACSALAGVLVGGLLAHFGVLPGGFAAGCAAGLVINAAAQGGDLLESAVKRSAGVKDSSTWMGASGGLLDVLDSLLLTVPAALLLWPLILP